MRKAAAALVCCAVLLWGASAAWANDRADEPVPAGEAAAKSYLQYDEPQRLEDVSIWGALARTIAALGIVLALLGGTLYGLRRLLPGAVATGGSGSIRLLGRLTVGPKQTVYFLRLPGRLLIMGSGGNDLTVLAEITDPDEIAELSHAATQLGIASGVSFTGLFQRHVSGVEAAVRRYAAGPEDTGLEGIRRHIRSLRDFTRAQPK